MAGEDLCRREGQWAARVERLHNVEQLHDIVRQRLTDVRSRGPSEYLFMAILGSTVAIQVAPRSHYPDGGRLATYSSRELRNTTKNHK